jgi:hypothetical protein
VTTSDSYCFSSLDLDISFVKGRMGGLPLRSEQSF